MNIKLVLFQNISLFGSQTEMESLSTRNSVAHMDNYLDHVQAIITENMQMRYGMFVRLQLLIYVLFENLKENIHSSIEYESNDF